MTLADVYQHPWCMRQSQLAQQGVVALAEQLTESLRATGDLGYAVPEITDSPGKDADGDDVMLSATCQSQFTQSLLLFSQTQSGRRYTPALTRFYTSLGPSLMFEIIKESLVSLGYKYKVAEVRGDCFRLRVGGHDHRKMIIKGWIELEKFNYGGTEGSFCLMSRDEGNPISWRTFWKSLVQSPSIEPHVLRRRA
ncbi:hypothetical protein BV22DRAFT_561589 [Leucogyrophana mollusca]|uniref:Uncharacterized protein n=1 Tax=Leucogyrophana mollusca TaxID=85980 RepID=A0ACB8BG12_9AGAM|nr:hypothetical protein BV22DRAFT_561589 [Leucogyrophana mollusca]